MSAEITSQLGTIVEIVKQAQDISCQLMVDFDGGSWQTLRWAQGEPVLVCSEQLAASVGRMLKHNVDM